MRYDVFFCRPLPRQIFLSPILSKHSFIPSHHSYQSGNGTHLTDNCDTEWNIIFDVYKTFVRLKSMHFEALINWYRLPCMYYLLLSFMTAIILPTSTNSSGSYFLFPLQ